MHVMCAACMLGYTIQSPNTQTVGFMFIWTVNQVTYIFFKKLSCYIICSGQWFRYSNLSGHL